MKSYKKYKNFIPDSFFTKISEERDKKKNILINLFVIFNLILIPINLKNIKVLSEKNMKNYDYKSDSNKENFHLDSIVCAIDELFSEEVEEVHINNNLGEIVVNNLKIAENIDKNSLVKINEATLIENQKYKIGVSINEK